MTADTVGGVWTYALELAGALTEADVEVHLATMGRLPSAAQRDEAAAVAGLVLHESAHRLEWMDDPWDDVARAGEWLLSLESRLAPEVVHLNGYAHAALRFAAPTVVVAHSCVCSWWRAVHGEEAPASWDAYRRAVRAGLERADAVVAPSAAMLAALEEHHGVRVRRGRVIPNGRDAARHPPREKERLVLGAGRLWDEAKNVGTLARAARSLAWPVLLAGDDAPPDGAPADAPGARMLGVLPQREMAEWMGRAAVFAHPARYEPFGLAPLEAALAGCALVLGDIPSLREVWGAAPRWVAPDDAAALARTLDALMRDDTARGAVAARCRRRALRYTPQRMVAGYVRLYETLLAERGAASTPEPEASCA
ncbi:MAG TPA: glycosyltransferase family 4 protein [Gemmatimonadaceae bacterium]|nr:glycosyltransferase family 4 protein [Gemmatimonadaceae bacterium]